GSPAWARRSNERVCSPVSSRVAGAAFPRRTCNSAQGPLRVWQERSEQPVGLVVQTRGEEQGVRRRAGSRGREPQPPEPVDRDRTAARATELTLEGAGHGVVRVDVAIPEVA